MVALIYRCPITGLKVQVWLADDVSENEGETFETVTCSACNRPHLISRSTGRVLGDDDKSAVSVGDMMKHLQ